MLVCRYGKKEGLIVSSKKVRKAVIAAAGFGTRFLPQTKAMPKEMLPLVDKPVIQYVVEELVAAGIEDIIIVTGYHKRSIEDHFDEISADLKSNLVSGGKDELMQQTERIAHLANFSYVRQKGVYGNATPILNVSHLVGDEPFIYTYADDLIIAKPNHFKQLIDKYEATGCSILPCLEVSTDAEFKRYGIIGGTEIEDGLLEMSTIVEKPGRENAPSNFASVGGYLLTPDIFEHLQEGLKMKTPEEEFQVQPTMRHMIKNGYTFYAMKITDAHYYDTGNKLEYLKTVTDFALANPELGPDFKKFLQTRLS